MSQEGNRYDHFESTEHCPVCEHDKNVDISIDTLSGVVAAKCQDCGEVFEP